MRRKLIAVTAVLALTMSIVTPAAEYSENDLYLLSHLIAGEANDCSTLMKQYVGSVALNRVEDSRFPDTLEEVINQPGQYSCTWDGNFERTPTDRNWAVARYLLENGSQIPVNVVYQAQHRQGHGVYGKFGREYLCYK